MIIGRALLREYDLLSPGGDPVPPKSRAVLLSGALSGGGEGAVEVDHVARDPGQAR
jgi:hypothetical protein